MASDIFTDDFKLEPYWWEATPRPVLETAVVPATADVAIVGSGYTGLNAALVLARAGRSRRGVRRARRRLRLQFA